MLSDHQSLRMEQEPGGDSDGIACCQRGSAGIGMTPAPAKDKTVNSLFTVGHRKNGIIAIIPARQRFNDCSILKVHM